MHKYTNIAHNITVTYQELLSLDSPVFQHQISSLLFVQNCKEDLPRS